MLLLAGANLRGNYQPHAKESTGRFILRDLGARLAFGKNRLCDSTQDGCLIGVRDRVRDPFVHARTLT